MGEARRRKQARAARADQRRPPIPTDVRRRLRSELGFVCAFPAGDSPYLEYHHFDPPWAEGQLHDPKGMIALCGKHHPLADGGAFTKEQLHAWKVAKREVTAVSATVHWRRESAVFRLGGGICVGVPIILTLGGKRAIWLTKADDGNELLNFDLHSADGSIAFEMRDNVWTAHPNWDDIEVPPQGRSLDLRADRLGIRLSLQFRNGSEEEVTRLIGERGLELLARTSGDLPKTLPYNRMLICEMEGELPWPHRIKLTPTHVLWGGASLENVVMLFGRSFLNL
jgi:hypothetical protein